MRISDWSSDVCSSDLKTSKIVTFVWLYNIRIVFELAAVLYVGITALFYPASVKSDFMNVVLVLAGVAVALYVLEIGLTRSVRIGWCHPDRLHQRGEKEKFALAVFTRVSFVLWVRIGSASGWETECQYVKILVGAGFLKKNKQHP